MQLGYFSHKWNMAILRPSLKKSNLDLYKENYQPVSDLSFVSKIVECVGMSQIMKHCENQNLMLAHQSAYCKFHSCETLLMCLINDILWTMEHGKIMGVIFWTSLWHLILLIMIFFYQF